MIRIIRRILAHTAGLIWRLRYPEMPHFYVTDTSGTIFANMTEDERTNHAGLTCGEWHTWSVPTEYSPDNN